MRTKNGLSSWRNKAGKVRPLAVAGACSLAAVVGLAGCSFTSTPNPSVSVSASATEETSVEETSSPEQTSTEETSTEETSTKETSTRETSSPEETSAEKTSAPAKKTSSPEKTSSESQGSASSGEKITVCQGPAVSAKFYEPEGAGAAGSIYYQMELTNSGKQCQLAGEVALQFLKAPGGEKIGEPIAVKVSSGRFDIPAGGMAYAQVQVGNYANYDQCNAVAAGALTLNAGGAQITAEVPNVMVCADPQVNVSVENGISPR